MMRKKPVKAHPHHESLSKIKSKKYCHHHNSLKKYFLTSHSQFSYMMMNMSLSQDDKEYKFQGDVAAPPT